MAKFILENETQRAWFDDNTDRSNEELLKQANIDDPDAKWTAIKRVPHGSHICKYCYDIAEGTYEELLCRECRETFGHSLYSEL